MFRDTDNVTMALLIVSKCHNGSSNTVKKAAVIFRETVKKTIDESETLPWPPTIESLRKDDRNAPDILKLFYENLLSPASVHHGTSSTAERLIETAYIMSWEKESKSS